MEKEEYQINGLNHIELIGNSLFQSMALIQIYQLLPVESLKDQY